MIMPRQIAERADLVPKLAELFRQHGYAGTSLGAIGRATGLGKGSLYHFFPGGKRAMAEAVLAESGRVFAVEVLGALRHPGDPKEAIREMCRAVDRHYRAGRRVCLYAAFARDATREEFAPVLRRHFQLWTEALAQALVRAGRGPAAARTEATDALAAIEGAMALARAADDPRIFAGALARLEARLLA